MHDTASSAGRNISAKERDRASRKASRPVRKQSFHLCALGLLALAIAAALWGYGYNKLSLNKHTFSAVHFPAAKIWIQGCMNCAPVSTLRVRPHARRQFDIGTGSNFTPLQSFSPVQIAKTPRIFAPPRALPFFHSALPLRSPPSFAA